MPDENPKTESVLTDELLKLQAHLEGIEDLHQSMNEAKRLVELAASELKTRADDQWGITQRQLESLKGALEAIEQSAKSSTSLASSLGELAGQISAVDFPARLNAIESVTADQARQVADIRSICADLKDQAESVRADFAKLRDSTESSVGDLAAKVGSSLNALNSLLALARDLATKVESTNVAISTLASSISTLQSQLFRELASVRKEIEQSDSSTKSSFGLLTQKISNLKKWVTLVGLGVLLNAVLIGAVLWKVFR
jgi:hypothetical protein